MKRHMVKVKTLKGLRPRSGAKGFARNRALPTTRFPRRRSRANGWRLLLLLGLAGIVVLRGDSYAEHTAALQWMMGYTSAEGVGCCSERDCHPWPVAVVQLTGDQAMVR